MARPSGAKSRGARAWPKSTVNHPKEPISGSLEVWLSVVFASS